MPRNHDTPYRRGNIFLIGMMLVGKTTVGRALAQALSREFVDCDEAFEAERGSSIKCFFDIAGEAAFRQLEEQLLLQLVQRDNTVISSGGGAVLSAAKRAALRANGYVVYLSARLSKLVARARENPSNLSQRPMLGANLEQEDGLEQAVDEEQRLRTLLAQRNPLYRETADTVIAIGNDSPEKLAQRIIQCYNKAIELHNAATNRRQC